LYQHCNSTPNLGGLEYRLIVLGGLDNGLRMHMVFDERARRVY
jgi:hypothetical protein